MTRAILLLTAGIVAIAGFPSLVRATDMSGPSEQITVPASGSSSRSTSSSAGTTINQQTNAQNNNNQFYGLGPGIQCPTPTLGFSLYGARGNGTGTEASVASTSYGGMITFTTPIGGRNATSCEEMGEAQIKAVRAQVERTQLEAAKTQTDINLVTIQQCIGILEKARLSGPFVDACAGVSLVAASRPQTPAPPQATSPAPPQAVSSSSPEQVWLNLQTAVAVWDLDTALASLAALKQSSGACLPQFADRFATVLRQQGVQGFRQINPIKRALNQQQGCNLPIQSYEFSP
ncbi:MAG: hypothetical protein KGQ93_15050 [Cyanobacteria bacterium REEB459]|nr:hypothetical protein [Cyanobacteria bacterium REEB459]